MGLKTRLLLGALGALLFAFVGGGAEHILGAVAPAASPQSLTTPQDTPLVITLSATDADSTAQTFSIVTPPAHGSLGPLGAPVCLPLGAGSSCRASVTYTPSPAFSGGDSFAFKAKDGALESAVATVSITVTARASLSNNAPATPGSNGAPLTNGAPCPLTNSAPLPPFTNNGLAGCNAPNAAPVAGSQSLSTPQGSPLAIALGATDPDSPALTFSIVTPPAHGTLSPLGAPACLPAGGGSSCTAAVTYTPNPGYSGPDSFSFKANDGALDSNLGTVDVVVLSGTGVTNGGGGGACPLTNFAPTPPYTNNLNGGGCLAPNQPPVAQPQSVSTGQGAAKAIALFASDANSPSLTFSIVAPPLHGTLTPLSAPNCLPSGGGVNCQTSVFYTPNPGFTGTDSFTFKANDGSLDSNVAAVTIAVTAAANAAPQAFGPNFAAVPGTPKQVSLLGTDSDSAALSFALTTPPAKGTVVLGAPNCTPNGGGTKCTVVATYTATLGQTGSDSFSFKANDGVSDSNLVTIVITLTATPPANTPPTAQNLSAVASRNGSAQLQLAASDPDSPALSFAIVTPPQHGTLTLISPLRVAGVTSAAANSLQCTPTGAGVVCTQNAIYTPSTGYSGPDSFTYKANDGAADSNLATATIDVLVPPNSPPAATGQSQTVGFNQPKLITLAGSDTDSAALTFAIVSPPAKGTLTIGATSCVPSGGGSSCTQAVTYTPNPGQTGADSFSFKVNDGTSDSAPATVTLNILNAPIGAAPTASPQTVGVALNTPKLVTLAAADTDSATLTFAIVSTPSHGTVTLAAPVCLPAGGGSNCTDVATYTPTSGYNGPDAFTFKANDGTSDSNIATVTINVAPDIAPVVTTSAGNSTFTEGGAAVVVDATLTVTDADNANLASATVTITNILNAGLETLAANTGGTPITQAYNAGTGVLTLTGPATVAQFQQVLRTVTYRNTASPINLTTRVVRFVANDGVLPSNNGDKNVAITPLNAPVVTPSAGNTAFTEGAGPVVADPAITVSDIDSPNLASAQVVIQTGCQPGEDVLGVTAPLGITAVYTPATCTLALTGSQPVALYQNTLRTVTYNNTSQNPNLTTRVLRFTANDGTLNSNNGDKNVTITAVNQAPVLTTTAGTTAFTEAGPAVAIDNGLTLTDVDSANLASATVQITTNCQSGQDVLGFTNQNGITGNYVAAPNCLLTLTGSSTVANYQTALRSVTYNNTSQNPNTTNRVVSFIANDGALPSNTGTRTVSVTAVNNPPVITLGLVVPNFTEGGGPVVVDAGLTVADPDNANLASGTVSIVATPDGSFEVLNASNCAGLGLTGTGTATLTLATSGTLAAYQACLQSVTYDNTSLNPTTTPRSIRFVVNDGTTPSANADKALTVNGVNTAPVVTTSAGTTPFTEAGPAVVIDAGVTVTDADSPNLASATVQVTTNCQSGEDVLGFSNQNGISGVYTAAPSCILALTGSSSVANYQTALQSVTYNNSSQNPNTTSRVVSFIANDGVAPSNTATKTVSVTAVNNAPVLTVPAGTLAYTEGDPATGISGTGVTITDADSTTMATGSVVISGNCATAEDVLSLAPSAPVTTTGYVPGTCTLPLSGVATLAQWQTALENVRYNNTSVAPSVLPRTVTYKVNDGTSDSNLQTHGITVASVNSAPVVTTSAGTTTWNSFGGPQVVDSTITVTDADSLNLASATITIMNPSIDGALEVLGPTAPTAGCPAGFSFLAGLNTLTISGTMTVAQYQTCLRTVTFDDTAASPATGIRTIRFVVNDGTDNSNNGDKLLNVVVPAPIAQDDPGYTATGNIQISVAAPGVLGNDTLNGGAIVSYGASTGNEQLTVGSPTPTFGIGGVQGSVTLNLDGSFTYDPPVGVSAGTDTFVYKLQNSNPTPDTATVTITIGAGLNQIVWFVNNNPGACVSSCDGRFTHPFTSTGTLQTAQGTANGPAAGEALFIYESATPYTGTNLTLLGTQKLIGQDATGTFDAAIGFTPNAASTGPLPPLIPGGTPVLLQSAAGNTLTLGSSNTVRGLTFGSTPATSLVGTGFGTLTINDVIINNPGGGGVIALNTGAFGASSVIDSITATNGGSADGILLTSVTGSFTVNGSGTLASSSSGAAFSVVGGTVGATYSGNISQAGTGPLVSVSGGHTTGTITFQTGTLSASNGTGLQFNNADSITTYNFNGTTTLSGGDAGIDILNGSAGTFNFGGTTINNPSGVAFLIDSSAPTVTGSGAISKTSSGRLIDINAMSGGSVALSGNLSSTSASTGISITNTTNSPTITFSGGTKTLSTGATNAVVLGANSATTAVNFTNGGLDIDTTTGDGINASGGVLTVQTGANNNTINTTTGAAVRMPTAATIGAGGMTFATVSTSGAANGILLANTGAGAFTANGGSIANATTRGVDLNAIGGNFTYAGTISTSGGAARSVEVTGTSSGTARTILFSGLVTDTSLGINLDNNDQGGNTHIVSFTGGISASTGANTAFNATNGGTINVSGSNNNLTTTTGTAVNLNAVGGAITLTSVSANTAAAALAPNGIVIQSTSAGFSFTVNGDGTNTAVGGNSSGGTITRMEGADGAVAGNGVYLSSTQNVTLRRMTINGTNQNHGIRGTSVSGFHLEYSTVTGSNGNNIGIDEGSVNFDNMSGTSSIVSSFIDGGLEDNLNIVNTSGTLNLTITGSTFGFNNTVSGNNNILLESQNAGTVFNFTLQSSLIKGARADWINASNNSGSTMSATIGTAGLGNTFDNTGANAHPGAAAGGNRVVLGATGPMTFDINGNSTKGSKGEAIRVRSTAVGAIVGTANGHVRNNTIGVQATANSGSSEGSGIFVFGDGGSDMIIAVTDNDVFQYNNSGIRFLFGDEINDGSSFSATVKGNTASDPGNINTEFNGLLVTNGSVSATDNFTSCLTIGGSTAPEKNTLTNGSSGVTPPNNANIRLNQRFNTRVELPGYVGPVGGGADVPEVVTYLTGRNTLTTGAANTDSGTGGFFNTAGGAACTLPTAP